MCHAWVASCMLALSMSSSGAAQAGTVSTESGEAQRGYAALRALDCARCHGRDFDGWAAPSLLAAVRDGSRERFDWYVLKGDATRGMPGYESQPFVVAHVESMYAWLVEAARRPRRH